MGWDCCVCGAPSYSTLQTGSLSTQGRVRWYQQMPEGEGLLHPRAEPGKAIRVVKSDDAEQLADAVAEDAPSQGERVSP